MVLSIGLGACGFSPLYASHTTEASINQALSRIYIKPIQNHIGQLMRLELENRLSPKGHDRQPAYEMYVNLSESTSTLAVDVASFATRANLNLNAKYQLVRRSDQTEVISGHLATVASYNILSSDFATSTAKNNARKLAVINLAERLKNRLAIYIKASQTTLLSPTKSTKSSPYGYPNQ